MASNKRKASQMTGAGPSTTVAGLQTSMATLGVGTTTAVAPCPKKAKTDADFDVKVTGNDIQFSGRPAFAKSATDIKVNRTPGQLEDRRHVLGYDDTIRPTFQYAASKYLEAHGEAALKTKLMQLNQAAVPKMFKVPKANRPIEDHLRYSLTQLNSTPGNLNPELASENQAIEVVREQAQHARHLLAAKFADDVPDVATTKQFLLDHFDPNRAGLGSGTPITDFARQTRTLVHARLQNATADKELIDILGETETSTGIDLNKTPGSKKQTSYALQAANDLREARDPSSDLSAAARLEAVYRIRSTPK